MYCKKEVLLGVNNNLKELREINNLTQRDMAKVLNITVSAYNRKENGSRAFTLEEAGILARYFRVCIEGIFGGRRLRSK
ncbi:helix-turn-helix transcriptional regulator [Clostridium cochlearium]|uniref:helix-turn-helix transcriptional regulator n=1 Tax=Clostridium cochlearium TaxID=1494 RepID=UPI000BBBBF9A|nr:helix-turn-helix transcriptional regulator [Clostridium cochlearium]